ncbi:uncharacterized protein MYCFIDRAFT_40308 [Pseudocercospora fijiensis CIRAD86]|uniref:Ribosomal lysine N-methyltransferase 4 n=1 Tax=Pseudocercospora fijiensis (strain CIRAD86) TaxID=383855 RepID=M2ZTS7_PSEFD|nr:uncharacterized protein MYCFIDRAFT_40308 [Pseudocercospora fijiensis CIRAD86]EME82409.1 hypothetical protein MYCFIDRAFT_40308 [Pseudocercospora fijiensis CIRAD86]
MDIDDFQSMSDKFLTWLKNTGATISPKIQLADLRDRAAGRGVVATSDLTSDEEIFRIPRTSILTTETTDLPQEILQQLTDPWLSLILAMIFEYLLGTNSRFKPYLDILPESFNTLMFWTDNELQYLQGSAILSKIGKEEADNTFSEQLLPIITKNPEIFKIGTCNNQDLLALCHRMGSIIMSYAFDLDPPPTTTTSSSEEWESDSDSENEKISPKALIPLADMLNANGDLTNSKLFFSSDSFIMKTLQPVAAGEELLNDFGPLPPADLLRRYGFVTKNYSKWDVVEISAEKIKDCVKVDSENEIYAKFQYAEEQGVLDDAYDIARPGNEEGQFSEELCVFLNLLVLRKGEFEKMVEKEKLPKVELSVEAKRLLRRVLVHRYSEYPVEKELRESGSSSTRMEMARQVIEGEKEVIREAIEAVTDDANTNKKRAADTLEEEAAAIRNPVKK